VKLLRHPDGENRGAGASRNLGMKNASSEYIAFLDADDYYLPGRFAYTKRLFESDPNCDGVYEAAGTVIENEEGLLRWTQVGRSPDSFYTMKENILPEALPLALLNSGTYGYFILDSFTVKTDVLIRSGLMNEQLRLHQDTDFIIRTSCISRLLPGKLDEPVSMVRVHSQNRISTPRSLSQMYGDRMAFWMSLYRWAKINTNTRFQEEIRKTIIRYTRAHKYFRKFPLEYFPTRLIWLTRLARLIKYPEVIVDVALRRIKI